MQGHPCFEDVAAMRREQAADSARSQEQREAALIVQQAILLKLSNGLGHDLSQQIIDSAERTTLELNRLRKTALAVAVMLGLWLLKVAPETAAEVVKWVGK